MTEEIYVSTDIESDGPIPGPNSMLSFGSAAFTVEKGLFNTFAVNLEELPGAKADPLTMSEFWDKQPEAWTACRLNPMEPKLAMTKYVKWLNSLPGRPVFVGYPATFDFMFVYHYLIYFTGSSPFSFSALDIKSFAMAKLGTDFRRTTKKNMPRKWFSAESPHAHVALDDAIEQGKLFMNILRWKG